MKSITCTMPLEPPPVLLQRSYFRRYFSPTPEQGGLESSVISFFEFLVVRPVFFFEIIVFFRFIRRIRIELPPRIIFQSPLLQSFTVPTVLFFAELIVFLFCSHDYLLKRSSFNLLQKILKRPNSLPYASISHGESKYFSSSM
jgi:hypothetical protein